MKTTLHTAARDGGPFNCLPAREIELEDARILCNDVTLPWDEARDCRTIARFAEARGAGEANLS